MNDLTKQIRDCIDICRSENKEMTVRFVADTFMSDLSKNDIEAMKHEALDNLIISKVRSLFKSLESTSSMQMELAGVDCPTYICTNNECGGNQWVHTDDATITHWRSWLSIKMKNKTAVLMSFRKDEELVNFMESILGHDENLTTKEAMARFMEKG